MKSCPNCKNPITFVMTSTINYQIAEVITNGIPISYGGDASASKYLSVYCIFCFHNVTDLFNVRNSTETLETNLKSVLSELCEYVHSACDSDCPVYDFMTDAEKDFNTCEYFRKPKSMLEFIRKRNIG